MCGCGGALNHPLQTVCTHTNTLTAMNAYSGMLGTHVVATAAAGFVSHVALFDVFARTRLC